jgi:hypothetical protein
MPASITSPTDIVNLALRRIGYKLRVGSLYDGSMAAKMALDVYAQTRDALLRSSDWGFAEVIAAAAVSGGAAPAPWAVEYTYPASCIKLRNIFNAAYLADKNNPIPVLWTIADAAAGKVIWTNATSATLIFTSQITDPTKWEPLFVELLTIKLAERLAPSLAGMEAEKIIMEDEKTTMPLAIGTLG